MAGERRGRYITTSGLGRQGGSHNENLARFSLCEGFLWLYVLLGSGWAKLATQPACQCPNQPHKYILKSPLLQTASPLQTFTRRVPLVHEHI